MARGVSQFDVEADFSPTAAVRQIGQFRDAVEGRLPVLDPWTPPTDEDLGWCMLLGWGKGKGRGIACLVLSPDRVVRCHIMLSPVLSDREQRRFIRHCNELVAGVDNVRRWFTPIPRAIALEFMRAEIEKDRSFASH